MFGLTDFIRGGPSTGAIKGPLHALTTASEYPGLKTTMRPANFISFSGALRTCRTDEEETRLFFECAVPWLALEMHHDQDTAMPGIVQARLLAGESVESIGRKIGVKCTVVSRYTGYFFERPRPARVSGLHSQRSVRREQP